jgi:hypothetical protein
MSGKRVYAAGSGDDWKEDHCAAGALYKVGDPQNPVDPRVNEGTWSATEEYIEEDGVFRGGITYNYTGSTTTYPFYLNVDNTTTPTTVYFCNPVTDEQIAASTYLSAMPGGLDCN